MSRLIFVFCLVSMASSLPSAPAKLNKLDDRGFLDWINSLIGNPATTLRPFDDPPGGCPSCQCGIARSRRRIVGGYETKVLEFPWMALLMNQGQFYCGGSLLNDLYVLTAAHCLYGFPKESITVRFMEHDRSVANETKTFDRNVAYMIIHMLYNPLTIDNDIALLKLDKRVEFNNALKQSGDGQTKEEVGIRPVCLPSPGLTYTNYSSVVTGWGSTKEGGSPSDTLQEVYVPIMSNEDCRKTLHKQRITDNMLCAGFPEGGRDACQGDSGGPLHIKNSDEQFQQVGIVSWGQGCAQPDTPGVYTRLNRYLSWLASNTKDACYCQ